VNNIRLVKRLGFPEDPGPDNKQQPNEMRLADQDIFPVFVRLQVRVTESDWEDVPVVWEGA